MESYFENNSLEAFNIYPFPKGILMASSSTARRLFLGVPANNIFML